MSAVKAPDFLVHSHGDSVAVATRDLPAGTAEGGYLEGPGAITVELTEPVPLGHKLALREIDGGAQVIEYGVCVALASKTILPGQHAHIHNLRSLRWQNSVAS